MNCEPDTGRNRDPRHEIPTIRTDKYNKQQSISALLFSYQAQIFSGFIKAG